MKAKSIKNNNQTLIGKWRHETCQQQNNFQKHEKYQRHVLYFENETNHSTKCKTDTLRNLKVLISVAILCNKAYKEIWAFQYPFCYLLKSLKSLL